MAFFESVQMREINEFKWKWQKLVSIKYNLQLLTPEDLQEASDILQKEKEVKSNSGCENSNEADDDTEMAVVTANDIDNSDCDSNTDISCDDLIDDCDESMAEDESDILEEINKNEEENN